MSVRKPRALAAKDQKQQHVGSPPARGRASRLYVISMLLSLVGLADATYSDGRERALHYHGRLR
jgi:hypothetical protein